MQIKNKFLVLIIVFTTMLSQLAFAYPDNEIKQAMRDEIKRTLNQLYLETLEKPYYVEYYLTFSDPTTVHSTLGEITESESNSDARLTVGLRIGNYKFDNSNYLDFGFRFFGSGDDEEGFRNRNMPLELDYKSLRRELWLATDAAYKQESEVYSKKIASLKNRMRKDTTHDFLKIEPEILADTTAIPKIDKGKIETICKSLSSIFKSYPEIFQSSAGVEFIPERTYYVNSEGREFIRTDFYLGLEVVAFTQSDDGMMLSDYYTVFVQSPNDLPTLDSMTKAVRQLAENLKKSRKASTLEESYSGPVLFEGQAAAELFAQVFAPNLVTQRMPMTERGIQESDRFTAFQTKIGGRVLPEFLSVTANPEKDKFNGTYIFGSYKIDDDGVKAKSVNLVEKGYLKTLLSSRVPTRRVRETNGHRRGGAPMISALYITSDKEHQKSRKDLKNKMLKLCKDRELEFGIIVRKVLDQNILYTTLSRISAGRYPVSRGDKEISLIEVVKIYPDGREEPIRGVKGKGLGVASFKDILDVGNNTYIMNYIAPSITSSYYSGGSQWIGATIVCPDLLIEDAEIKPMEDDFPKPPLISNPIAR
jgi:hypothetical protein